MAQTKEQIALELSILEDEFKVLEKRFLADGIIHQEEQKQLNKLKQNIAKIKKALEKAGVKENKQAKKELKGSFKQLLQLVKDFDTAEDIPGISRV